MYRDARIMKIFEGPTEALMVYLDRLFSSRATASLMAAAFAKIGGEDLYSNLVDRMNVENALAADREVYRGWSIALSFAIGVCRADKAAEEYLSRRLAITLNRVEEKGSALEGKLPGIIEEFLASTNGSIGKPEFGPTFMAVKGFV
jgi:hypothetical protein